MFQRTDPSAGIHTAFDFLLVDFFIQVVVAEVISLAAADGAAHTICILPGSGPHVETGVAEVVVVQTLHSLLQHLVAARTHNQISLHLTLAFSLQIKDMFVSLLNV